jgi:FkbM family methyltransferase
MRELDARVSFDQQTSTVAFDDYRFAFDFEDKSAIPALDAVFATQIFGNHGVSFENKIIVDVGAYIGDSAIYFAKHGASRVIAYEPIKATFEYLTRNIALNKVENIVRPFNKGVSGVREALLVRYNPALTSAASSVDHRLEAGSSVSVECITLADIFTENDINKVDVLKLNCEGCEFSTILNAKESTLRKIATIILFYHIPNPQYTLEDIIHALESKKFNLMTIDQPKGSAWKPRMLLANRSPLTSENGVFTAP